jgi:phosphoribosylaminoimidazolecarboxamide formyltransferase / IMP cyclohydrolase
MSQLKIRSALISVFDKTNVLEFARGLAGLGVKIISTGGTFKLLEKDGVPVVPVEKVTGFPEMMHGRVKTLHPSIHAGILADRDVPEHIAALETHKIQPIDLVCVNLYPFVKVTSDPNCTFPDAIENIDIGGPTMVRAASKNHKHVVIVTSPDQYGLILEQLRQSNGTIDGPTRLMLAQVAFKMTAEYDIHIQEYLAGCLEKDKAASVFPNKLLVAANKSVDLRYGENPHQSAALYLDTKAVAGGWGNIKQLSGKELSFNNIVDANAALELCMEFTARPTVCIIKHTNPCGVASDDNIVEAYRRAYLAEPNAAMGGIIAVNRAVDSDLAEAIVDSLARWGKGAGAGAFFAEIIIAPIFTAEALEILTTRKPWGKEVRLLEVRDWTGKAPIPLSGESLAGWDLKRIRGGFLTQTRDDESLNENQWKIVGAAKPTDKQMDDLRFAWLVCKHVKSNAIVLAKNGTLLGAGAGQMARINSARLACEFAGNETKGAVMASDAFFPFRDSIDQAAKVGITAVIEPGGSKRDAEVIAAANEHNIVLIFTGTRHFKH